MLYKGNSIGHIIPKESLNVPGFKDKVSNIENPDPRKSNYLFWEKTSLNFILCLLVPIIARSSQQESCSEGFISAWLYLSEKSSQ